MQKSTIANRHLMSIACVFLLLVSQTACTATRLPPYEATYTTKLRGIKIKGVRKFEIIDKDTYRLSWEARALWMRLNEWSTFKIIDEKVIPLSYHYTRKGLGSNRPVHVNFDWTCMQVNSSKGDDEYHFELEPGTLDKLSFQVQLQLDLLHDHNLKLANFRVASHDRIKDYNFSFVQQETIETNLGPQNTLVFERSKNDGGTRLWISPEQNYLPIQIENIDDGDSNVLSIKSWESEKVSDSPDSVALREEASEEQDLDQSSIASEEDDFD